MITIIKSLGCRKSPTAKKAQSWVLAKCSYCDSEYETPRSHVGRDKSCGCAKGVLCASAKIKHGEKVAYRKTRETSSLYRRWCHMKERCFNPTSRGYKFYGAKGVRVCDQWLEYSQFKVWAEANGYAKNLEIDRIDPRGDYCPENCRWVAAIVNRRNRTITTMSLEKAKEIRAASVQYPAKALAEQFSESKAVIYNVLGNKSWVE